MKETITLTKSVGSKGTNRFADVQAIQARLNKWIAFGRLPGLAPLGVDGQCGAKSKLAIGAFQLRYVPGVSKPDCRVDPGGETLRFLCMDFSQGNAPAGDPVQYNDYLNQKVQDESTPYWEKRGMFWCGVGVKASVGVPGVSMDESGGAGHDLSLAVMYNLKDPSNRFMMNAHTRRVVNVGAGASGGPVLCFATGMYHPNDFDKIQSGGLDFNLALVGKWTSFARWASRLNNLDKIISAAKVNKYANGGTVSGVVSAIKGTMAGFDVKEDDPMPSFITIDLPVPVISGGLEASLYYGITSYNTFAVKLT